MNIRGKLLTGAAAVAILLSFGTANAAEPEKQLTLGGTATKKAGDIMVRLRGVGVLPDTNTNSVTVINGNVDISNNVIPEADFTYFFTPYIAVEAIAGVSKHSLTDKGSTLGEVDLGSVWLLPPTVTLQYHPFPNSQISPYVGAGLNYTFFYDSKATKTTVTNISYKDNWGYAFQAGVDYNVMGNWYLNLDVKKIFLSTKVDINKNNVTGQSAIHGDVDIDPWFVGVGIGYKF